MKGCRGVEGEHSWGRNKIRLTLRRRDTGREWELSAGRNKRLKEKNTKQSNYRREQHMRFQTKGKSLDA